MDIRKSIVASICAASLLGAVGQIGNGCVAAQAAVQGEGRQPSPFCALLGECGSKKGAPVAERRNEDVYSFDVRASNFDEFELLRLVWMESPYPGYFYVLRVYRDGNASLVRDVPDWARQGVGKRKLAPKILAELVQRLGRLDDYSRLTASVADPGQTYVAVSYTDGSSVRKYRFSGSLPADVERIVRLVSTAMEAKDQP